MKYALIITAFFLFTACGNPAPPPNSNVNTKAPPSGNKITETRDLKDFDKLRIAGNMEAEIAFGPEFSFVLEGDDNILPEVLTQMEDGYLAIGLKEKRVRSVIVKLKITMPALTELEISGTSRAAITGIKTDTILLRTNGGARITASGETTSLDARAHGASGIDAENIKARYADVEALGISTITLNVYDKLRALTAGESSVIYTGDPRLEKTASDGSKIEKKPAPPK